MLKTFGRYATFLAVAGPFLAGLAVGPVHAQSAPFPQKPVKIVVGFAPGGGTDTVARILAASLSKVWGQSTIVENHAGAGGQLAADIVGSAKPDGYTILFDSSGFTLRPSLEKEIKDPTKTLTPISLIASAPYALFVNANLPAQNVQDLIRLAKEKPGTLNFASSGAGGGTHMSTELFKMIAGVDIRHIPYKGVVGLTDVVSGRVDMMITGLQAMPMVEDGKLRALAVTSATRSAKLPNVPTMQEAGVTGYDYSAWYGVFAPAGTPEDVLKVIGDALKEALKQPDVQGQFDNQGMEIVGMPRAEFEPFVKTEYERWRTLVAKAGITVQ